MENFIQDNKIPRRIWWKLPVYFLIIILLVVFYFVAGAKTEVIVRNQFLDIAVTTLAGAYFTGYTVLKLAFYTRGQNLRRIAWLEDRLLMLDEVSYRVRGAGKEVFNNLPIGMIAYNEAYEITWGNNFCQEIFSNVLKERGLQTIHSEMYKEVLEGKDKFMISAYNKNYDVIHNKTSRVIYLFEVTSRENLVNKYTENINAIGVMQLDNYENAMSELGPQERTSTLSKYLAKITSWADEHGIYVDRLTEYKFIILMNKKMLDTLQEESFSILDDVREISYQSSLAVTLSIGVACEDLTSKDLGLLAEEQLEKALSRGGDQVVCNSFNQITYYGGKSTTIAKKDKVRVRVVANDLHELIERASDVVVMGHKYSDVDSFGASIAVMRMVAATNKKCTIVLDQNALEPTVSKIIKKAEREHVGLLATIAEPKEVLANMNKNTLLVVVDCHSQNITIEPKIVDKARDIVVIDHHRMLSTVIEDTKISYIEAYSSSSVELVSELIQFYPLDVSIPKYETTLMLAGLIIDTNDFTYRTSIRTFETAAYLKGLGADMITVRTLLREDIEIYKEKRDMLSNIEIFKDVFSIVKIEEEKIIDRTLLAKIADEALKVDNIEAAFAIGMIENKVCAVSARSFGDNNVQVIMEKMGGGGHFNNAATQVKNKTILETENELKEILSKLNEKSDNMKVILLEEIKGKGREGDTLDVPTGYATFLLNSKQAVEATPDNIRSVEEKRTKIEEEAKQAIVDMEKLKKLIEEKSVTMKIKLGQNGKSFGKINSKHIVDAFDEQHKIKLDRKKVTVIDDLDSLGVHEVIVQLHRKVIAKLEVQIIEE